MALKCEKEVTLSMVPLAMRNQAIAREDENQVRTEMAVIPGPPRCMWPGSPPTTDLPFSPFGNLGRSALANLVSENVIFRPAAKVQSCTGSNEPKTLLREFKTTFADKHGLQRRLQLVKMQDV